jgi:dGTP triphosphohydrolase
MDANQAKADASMKTYMQEMKDSMQEIMAKIEDSLREEIKSGQAEMRTTVSAFGDKMGALIAGMKDGQKKTVACQETMEARLECKEPSSKEMESEVEPREVPKEHAQSDLRE